MPFYQRIDKLPTTGTQAFLDVSYSISLPSSSSKRQVPVSREKNMRSSIPAGAVTVSLIVSRGPLGGIVEDEDEAMVVHSQVGMNAQTRDQVSGRCATSSALLDTCCYSKSVHDIDQIPLTLTSTGHITGGKQRTSLKETRSRHHASLELYRGRSNTVEGIPYILTCTKVIGLAPHA